MGLSDPLCLSVWDCLTPCFCQYANWCLWSVRPFLVLCAKRTEDGLPDSSVRCANASIRSAVTVCESHGDSSVAGTQGTVEGWGWGWVRRGFLPGRSDRDVSEHKQFNTNNAVFNSAAVIPVLLHSGVVPLFCLPPTVNMVLNVHGNHKAYN